MNRDYPPKGTYKVPEKNVLLISCIDLRLTDDLTRYMEYDNLTNRYDHFILAGCSLGITLPEMSEWHNEDHEPCKGHYRHDSMDFGCWWNALKNHLQIAVDLHNIHDIYIVEHEACGAYKVFVRPEALERETEQGCQYQSAKKLAQKILNLDVRNSCTRAVQELHIHCFRMDLRGNVAVLGAPSPSHSQAF